MNENQNSGGFINEERLYPPQYGYMPKIKPKCVYTSTDRCFAIAAVVLGFITLKSYIMSTSGTGLGLMASVAAALITLFNFLYCRKLDMKGSRTTTVLFISCLMLSLSFFFCDNDSVTMLSAGLIFVSNTYFAYASYHEGSRSVINNALRSIISPFYEFGAMFGALFEKREKRPDAEKPDQKIIKYSVLGALMSLPLCIAVIVLLGSADASFGNLFSISLDGLADWIVEHIFENIFILVFSVPVSMYIFAGAYSRAYKMKNEEAFEKLTSKSMRIVPTAMCAAFLSPLTFIYVIFTAMQAIHAFSASVLKAPDFTYSEYARSGFFQLCAVVVINLAVISVIMFFGKREKKLLPKILKIFIIVFSLLTHCLIVTALSKMLLYIRIYGMTPKRVQTSIFMAYLFVMFVVLIVKQFRDEISFTKIGYCLAAAVLVLMSLIPVDALITRYNIEQYEQGNIPWIGSSAMHDLDASAYPALAAVNKETGVKSYNDMISHMKNSSGLGESFEHMTAWDFNIQRYYAGKAISSCLPEEWRSGDEESLPYAETGSYTDSDGVNYMTISHDGREYVIYGIPSRILSESILDTPFACSAENDGRKFYSLHDTEDYIASYNGDTSSEEYFFFRAVDTIGQRIYTPPYIDCISEMEWE